MAKKKFKTGDVEIPENEFDPKKAKVRISIFIDGDVLAAFKKQAQATHSKYQTLMNEKLRKAAQEFASGHDQREELLSAVENRVASAVERTMLQLALKKYRERTPASKKKKAS